MLSSNFKHLLCEFLQPCPFPKEKSWSKLNPSSSSYIFLIVSSPSVKKWPCFTVWFSRFSTILKFSLVNLTYYFILLFWKAAESLFDSYSTSDPSSCHNILSWNSQPEIKLSCMAFLRRPILLFLKVRRLVLSSEIQSDVLMPRPIFLFMSIY